MSMESYLLAEGKVEAHVALADGRGQGSLQAQLGPAHALDGLRWDAGPPVWAPDGRHVHRLPGDGHLPGGEETTN